MEAEAERREAKREEEAKRKVRRKKEKKNPKEKKSPREREVGSGGRPWVASRRRRTECGESLSVSAIVNFVGKEM